MLVWLIRIGQNVRLRPISVTFLYLKVKILVFSSQFLSKRTHFLDEFWLFKVGILVFRGQNVGLVIRIGQNVRLRPISVTFRYLKVKILVFSSQFLSNRTNFLDQFWLFKVGILVFRGQNVGLVIRIGQNVRLRPISVFKGQNSGV